MRRVRASVWVILFTTVCAAGILALPAVKMSSVATETPASVTLTQVARGDVSQVIAAAGMVRYEQEYAAVCPTAGMVAQVYVQPGDMVRAGQALVRLDASAEEAAISSAFASDAAEMLLPEGVNLQQLASATLADAQARLDAMTLRAATDGRVADVYVSQYGGVAAGTVAVLLSGNKQQVVCPLVVRDAQQLQAGMQAAVLTDGEATGVAYVNAIGAARTDNLTGQVVCDVTLSLKENLPLPLGAPVEVEIIVLRCEGVTTVPVTALDADGCLWVAEQGRCWRVADAVIQQGDMQCWVSLPEGTTVIERPGQLLDGQRYREEKK